ncbi:hypothetical protein QQG91_08050 [Marivivens sp. LCG002]|uniref:hypothetical protein n=1 Tax=Marivivens sp. LCG002 TaxID=3051171 RepID=UPI0025573B8B|nr:hypothetical protein [Marivivens sp. LCG002]WIV49628.1 hypothetical protein QQG91_08050 [Marivivens sp. LCG002]
MNNVTTFSFQKLVLISIAYLVAHSFTTGLFDPIRSILAPNIPPNISLLFIPHGIRVIVFYRYGAWGYAYLTPPAFLMWVLEVFGNGNDFYLLLTGFVSLASTHAGVGIARALMDRNGNGTAGFLPWKPIVAAGLFASCLNSLCLTFLYAQQLDTLSFWAYLFGDIMGVLGAMVLVRAFLMIAMALNTTTGKE